MDRRSRICNKASRKNCKKKPNVRELQKTRKNLKITIRSTTDVCKERMLKDKLKFLDEHIAYKIKEDRGYLVKRVAESRSSNIDNGRKIWEVNWKVKRKDETPHFIITVKEEKKKKRRNIGRISNAL